MFDNENWNFGYKDLEVIRISFNITETLEEVIQN